MRYAYYDLGRQQKGSTVLVRLRGSGANVLLLDSVNFRSYRKGAGFVHTGGYYRRSPVRLPVSEDGHWFVVLDLGGYRGRVRGEVSVLPPGGSSQSEETPVEESGSSEPKRRSTTGTRRRRGTAKRSDRAAVEHR